jgi:hypothetical protein
MLNRISSVLIPMSRSRLSMSSAGSMSASLPSTFLQYDVPHCLNLEMQDEAFRWLERWLLKDPDNKLLAGPQVFWSQLRNANLRICFQLGYGFGGTLLDFRSVL